MTYMFILKCALKLVLKNILLVFKFLTSYVFIICMYKDLEIRKCI